VSCRGDTDAFEELYRQHARRLYSLVIRMIGSAQDAEDLLRSVPAGVPQAARLSRRIDARHWLYRLTMIHCLDHLRGRQAKMKPGHRNAGGRERRGSGGTRTGRALRDQPDGSGARDRGAPAGGSKAAFLLPRCGRVRASEIAGILGISEGTSKSQVHKARLKLRALLKPMNCEQYDDRLDDYVDGSSQPDRSRSISRRGADVRHLLPISTSIRRAASMLEEYVPPPRFVGEDLPVRSRSGPAALHSGGLLPSPRRSRCCSRARRGSHGSKRPHLIQLHRSRAHRRTRFCRRKLNTNRRLPDCSRPQTRQRAGLDPETRAVVQQNLAAIDRAIDESRAALASEPAAPSPGQPAGRTRHEGRALQDTVALASEDVNQ
jgi:RNA polymerase sigma-70 factor (ECF subfamily)